MAKRQSRKSKMGIIVAVLLLAVGFAAVTTTLYINGTIRIVPDTQDFDKNVIFTKAQLTYSDSNNAASAVVTYDGTTKTGGDAEVDITNITKDSIVIDGKKIVFKTKNLKTIGETATLTYDIANKSQYNAQFNNPAVTCVIKKDGNPYTVDSTHPEYITVNATSAALDGQTLTAKTGTSVGNTLVITQVRSYAGETGVASGSDTPLEFTVECEIGATATDSN